MWDLSCRDWEERLRTGRTPIPELPLFEAEADLACRFFDGLRLPDVPGTPLMKDAGGEWFRDIVRALFGALDPDTGTRWIREIFALIGKGNSKTTNGALLMIAALLMNRRPRGEFLFVGPTQAISDLAYSQAAGAIELDAELRKRFQVRDHLKEIHDRANRAKLRVKTFDLQILTGPRPVGVLLDELHLLGKHPDTAKVLRQIRGGMEKSPEAFLVMITTQSDAQPAGAFRDELNYARAVRDGTVTSRMLPVLYEFPDEIARSETVPPRWQDASLWHMVMPNLGRSLQLESLKQDWEQERAKGASAIQVWASQHLNIEIGVGLKTDRWRGADHWDAAAADDISLDTILDRCEVVCVGVDGGGLDDLLGLCVLGRERVTRDWLAWGRAWADKSVLELRKAEAGTMLGFESDGDLVFVDDIEAAFAELADIAARVNDAGLLHQVGLDPMGVGAIVDALAASGISGDDKVVGVRQGWTLNGAIKTAEVKLKNRTLRHAGQRLLSWSVSNAKAVPQGNAVTITKQMSGAGKIDPLMALYDAIALMSRNPPALGASMYESQPLLVV